MMIRRHVITTLAAGLLISPLKAFSALGHDERFTFLVIGDWGTGGSLQKKVALGMRRMKENLPKGQTPKFVLSTGDNIYPSGVSSAIDPQWVSKYEKIYAGLDLPWWAVLGNHDHRGDVDAQVAYGMRNSQWNMPSRTWSKEFTVDSVTKVSFLALDTTPLLQKKEGWKEQLTWLESTLSASTAQKTIVVGHHPLRSYGHYGDSDFLVKNVKPILDQYRVALYCCGHEHDVQAIKHPSDSFGCLVSGGGGGSRPSKKGLHTKAVLSGGGFASVTLAASEIQVKLFDVNGNYQGRMNL